MGKTRMEHHQQEAWRGTGPRQTGITSSGERIVLPTLGLRDSFASTMCVSMALLSCTPETNLRFICQ